MSKPKAEDWIIFLRYAHITILLYANPLTTLTSLKQQVFTILQERYANGIPTAAGIHGSFVQLPESAPELRLARLADEGSRDKGWKSLEESEEEEDDEMSLKELGLNDGSNVAFDIGADSNWENVRFPSYDD